MAKKKAAPKKTEKGFEESLWDSANRLRGSVESSEYKHVVLSLIFLKFVSDKFEERRAELIDEGKGDYIDMVEFYTMKNVFYLPEKSRWTYIQQQAKQGDIALKIDTALTHVEKNNASLKGALPDNYFSRLGLDGSKLAALIDAINKIDTVEDNEQDTVGRVYEYFLGKFAASEGKLGGEFYTPKCVVNLIAEMIEPFKGKIYDPCCGSGGMFVQSLKFVQSHHGNTKDISVYGQEYTATTYKLAKMNLAVRGINANLGIDFEEKSFYDILKALTVKYDFEYPEDKLLHLAKEVKLVVDDKARYTDWSQRDDIKAELKADLIILLADNGYPPIDRDEVYKEIFEQAENFKKYQGRGGERMNVSHCSFPAALFLQCSFRSDSPFM